MSVRPDASLACAYTQANSILPRGSSILFYILPGKLHFYRGACTAASLHLALLSIFNFITISLLMFLGTAAKGTSKNAPCALFTADERDDQFLFAQEVARRLVYKRKRARECLVGF